MEFWAVKTRPVDFRVRVDGLVWFESGVGEDLKAFLRAELACSGSEGFHT